jgi:hypothetical protein
MRHQELHRTDRIGWLRAAVLGANVSSGHRESRPGSGIERASDPT